MHLTKILNIFVSLNNRTLNTNDQHSLISLKNRDADMQSLGWVFAFFVWEENQAASGETYQIGLYPCNWMGDKAGFHASGIGGEVREGIHSINEKIKNINK